MPAAGVFARFLTSCRLARNFLYDFRRYRAACFIDGARNRENLRAHIHLLSHMLEYGLSLSDPRAGFGMDKVRALTGDLSRYLSAWGRDASADNGLAVLSAYVAFNGERGEDVSEAQALFDELLVQASGAPSGPGGSEAVSAASIRAASGVDFLAFMNARHSVRQYDAARPVERDRIERAVAAAMQSPSSCNRQTVRVLAFTEKASIAKVLSHHNGNRGFGHQLGGLFVVTVDLGHWNTIGERNQGWVDGGMFAMTLALGLHAEGLGACMLNWSADMDEDRAMRERLGLDATQIIITLLGFGHMVENFRVPVSRRKPLPLVFSHEPPLQAG